MANKSLPSIGIIVCFFGAFPNYVDLWLKSCKDNPTIDWIIFTDQEPISAPIKNVRFEKISLHEMRDRISRKMGFQVVLERPYKLCDYKPVYGVVFEEYLRGYDFWGYCDLDMIFGDIRNFITQDVLNSFDKILWFGHLTLYRNTPEVLGRYKLPGGSLNYKTAFQTDKDFAFDEVVMNEIYQYHHLPIYNHPILVDIIFYRKHYSGFRIKNYSRQAFFWEKGRVFQAYQHRKRILQKEFLYIHFQKRSLTHCQVDSQAEAFYITPDGFFEKKPGVIHPDDFDKYNKNPGLLYEFIVMQWYFIKLRYHRLVKWLLRTFKREKH